LAANFSRVPKIDFSFLQLREKEREKSASVINHGRREREKQEEEVASGWEIRREECEL
jgi:chloramphenicol O-acetyltransferase